MAHPVAEVRLVMDCIQGDWETLDGGRRCRYRGTVRLTQSSLVDLERVPRVLETVVEWEQPTPTIFIPDDVSTPLLDRALTTRPKAIVVSQGATLST